MATADANSALSFAQAQAENPSRDWFDKCQTFVRTALGFSSGTADSAGDAWSKTPDAAKHPGDMNPPPGVPVYWTGGQGGYGHVALSAGDGMAYTTDMAGHGTVSLQSIQAINLWLARDHQYAGWADQEAKTGTLYGSGHSASWNDLWHPKEAWQDAKSVAGGAKNAVEKVTDIPGAIKDAVDKVLGWVKTGLIRAGFFIGGLVLILVFLAKEAKVV